MILLEMTSLTHLGNVPWYVSCINQYFHIYQLQKEQHNRLNRRNITELFDRRCIVSFFLVILFSFTPSSFTISHLFYSFIFVVLYLIAY